jgi:hypothetical protein
MRPLALLCATLALAGTARAADDAALWSAVFQLDEPEHEKKAASLLRSSGVAGYEVLSKAARVGGEKAALGVAAMELQCHMMTMRFHAMPMYGREAGVSRRAAKLATEFLLEDKALRERMLGSEEPFNRALALIASATVPGALPAALKRLENEKAPRVLEVVQDASFCAKIRTGAQVEKEAEQLSRRLKGTVQNPRCDQKDFTADRFVDGMLKGTYAVNGWSRSNDDFSVSLRRGAEESSQLAPPCALALYDALVRRGKYEPGLVIPITAQHVLPLMTRDAAAHRAVRDLPHYPQDQRNKLAAELVMAGYEVPVKVTFEKDGFAQELELEAAARQGNREALANIERQVFCRGTFVSKEIPMLGYLKKPEAAETAYQLAEQCPRAMGAATAALVRMGDPRGLTLLDTALKDFASRDVLERAILEAYTPALGRELRRLAASDVSEAQDMVERLRASGKMKD